ncbi:MAG: sulfatase-like hydrolase/transferase, partial [Verrucomicrobia bacterium]|nr:sulfatase-like hydrolase/transferase [Verrucomicrobiota bacterium]
FAKTLQANGYDTAMIGKWHITAKPNGQTSLKGPFSRKINRRLNSLKSE